ncbi:hypothetical protein DFP72DRAFT_561021 [Ephemerocybe angulata]|uniref:DUF6533 domain-containing protein n=1 Tax=Ephemerocybe angulata TaxID=980116 RepID=A0A8H6MBS7_9AGAR|nr:hypothetical protein DFP72DRAFT_561021 [Tulosesus angulatus]
MVVGAGSASAAAQAAALFGAISANKIVNYAAIASSTVLVVDSLQTLPQEMEYMWTRGMTIPKGMFFVLRYYSFVHTILSIVYRSSPIYAGDLCLAPFTWDSYSSLTVHTICDVVNCLRVYAFSGKSKAVLVVLSVTFATITGLQYYLLSRFIATVKFVNIPAQAHVGCIPSAGETVWLSAVFWLVLFSILMMTGMMIGIAYRRRSNFHNLGGLLRVFYRDGIWYFIILTTMAVTNIVFAYTAPSNGLQFTMVQIQAHLNLILIIRMLLHLREWAKKVIRPSPYLIHGNGNGTTMALGELELGIDSGTTASRPPKVFIEVNKNYIVSTDHGLPSAY